MTSGASNFYVLAERINDSRDIIALAQSYGQQTEIQKNAWRLINQPAKRGNLLISLFHRRDSLVLAERIQPHREIPGRVARTIQAEIDDRVVCARIDSFQKIYPG